MNRYSLDQTEQFPDGVSLAVVDAVAARRGVDTLEMPPLYHWVDPEALDSLFDPATEPTDRSFEFVYDGHVVTVDDTGSLSIRIDGTPVDQ